MQPCHLCAADPDAGYFSAVFMGADIDQPRNLTKSVTVE